ncbi:MAG: uncharacterized protein A8A55_1161 [Amphiamblys sp. WSBS2006]|nr:MAG: uncharacterized protein A8A55_1161 [Amphiamblys sp. WSBS2006]
MRAVLLFLMPGVSAAKKAGVYVYSSVLEKEVYHGAMCVLSDGTRDPLDFNVHGVLRVPEKVCSRLSWRKQEMKRSGDLEGVIAVAWTGSCEPETIVENMRKEKSIKGYVFVVTGGIKRKGAACVVGAELGFPGICVDRETGEKLCSTIRENTERGHASVGAIQNKSQLSSSVHMLLTFLFVFCGSVFVFLGATVVFNLLRNLRREHGEVVGGRVVRRLQTEFYRKKSTEEHTEVCPVCLSDFCYGDTIVTLSCEHVLHWRCAWSVAGSTKKCPICKGPVE